MEPRLLGLYSRSMTQMAVRSSSICRSMVGSRLPKYSCISSSCSLDPACTILIGVQHKPRCTLRASHECSLSQTRAITNDRGRLRHFAFRRQSTPHPAFRGKFSEDSVASLCLHAPKQEASQLLSQMLWTAKFDQSDTFLDLQNEIQSC